ncbi:MAG: VOC family protein [Solirubrobacteraceae bacterium]
MNPVVHLELHTRDMQEARSTYARLCGWQAEQLQVGGRDYTALGLGERIGGGVVECPTSRALWLPYVRVADLRGALATAERLEASVLLGPREGPAGWRAVVSTAAGGEIALWQPKEWCG